MTHNTNTAILVERVCTSRALKAVRHCETGLECVQDHDSLAYIFLCT